MKTRCLASIKSKGEIINY